MFSVIIPTFNRLELLKRAIDSVLNQSFQEFEIIVVDDYSSDGTWEWLKTVNNPKIKSYKNHTNRGLAFNRNYGVSKSILPYLAFLDDDDLWYNNHLSELRMLIEKHPNAGMYCNSYIIDYGDKMTNALHDNLLLSKEITKFTGFRCFKNTNALCAPSTITVKKIVFNDIGGFNPKTTVLEDVEFYIKIGIKYPIVHNRKITVEYAQNNGNHLSLNHVHLKKLPDLNMFEKYEIQYPYLKKWLDSIRFQTGLKLLDSGDSRYHNYFSKITLNNISIFQLIFIKLNYRVAKFVLTLKNYFQ